MVKTYKEFSGIILLTCVTVRKSVHCNHLTNLRIMSLICLEFPMFFFFLFFYAPRDGFLQAVLRPHKTAMDSRYALGLHRTVRKMDLSPHHTLSHRTYPPLFPLSPLSGTALYRKNSHPPSPKWGQPPWVDRVAQEAGRVGVGGGRPTGLDVWIIEGRPLDGRGAGWSSPSPSLLVSVCALVLQDRFCAWLFPSDSFLFLSFSLLFLFALTRTLPGLVD